MKSPGSTATAVLTLILLLVAISGSCYGQLTTASVLIDNKTEFLADVRFNETGFAPTTPMQTRRVAKDTQLPTLINVPIAGDGTFEVSATLYDPNVVQPSSHFEKIPTNAFKVVTVFQHGFTYYLTVTDLATYFAYVQEFGSEAAKKQLVEACKVIKESRMTEGAMIPSQIMNQVESILQQK